MTNNHLKMRVYQIPEMLKKMINLEQWTIKGKKHEVIPVPCA
jgi:hypothetical protein